MTNCLIVFILGFVLNFFFAFYVKAVSDGNIFKASNFAAALSVCTMYSFGRAADGGNIIAICSCWAAGQWLGTYFAMKLDNKNKDRD